MNNEKKSRLCIFNDTQLYVRILLLFQKAVKILDFIETLNHQSFHFHKSKTKMTTNNLTNYDLRSFNAFLLFVLKNTKILPHVHPAACRFHLYLSFQRFATWIDRSLIINPSLTTGIFPSAFKHLDPCGFGQIAELFLYKVLEENLFST